MRAIVRWLLAAILVFSGLGHLFWARKGYRVAVPDWVVETGRSAPLLRTDLARFIRLFLQPVLVAAAIWSTSAKSRSAA